MGLLIFLRINLSRPCPNRTIIGPKVVIRQNFLQLIMKMITACGYGVIIGMLFFSLVNAEITMGVFTAVLATMSNCFGLWTK